MRQECSLKDTNPESLVLIDFKLTDISILRYHGFKCEGVLDVDGLGSVLQLTAWHVWINLTLIKGILLSLLELPLLVEITNDVHS